LQHRCASGVLALGLGMRRKDMHGLGLICRGSRGAIDSCVCCWSAVPQVIHVAVELAPVAKVGAISRLKMDNGSHNRTRSAVFHAMPLAGPVPLDWQAHIYSVGYPGHSTAVKLPIRTAHLMCAAAICRGTSCTPDLWWTAVCSALPCPALLCWLASSQV
jgi:hypothetical protein